MAELVYTLFIMISTIQCRSVLARDSCKELTKIKTEMWFKSAENDIPKSRGEHCSRYRIFIVCRSSILRFPCSDPHIQCSFAQYEPWLFRRDADGYLQSSYSLLMSTLKPQMVIVLGDIFAEGYKASLQEWRDYLQV